MTHENPGEHLHRMINDRVNEPTADLARRSLPILPLTRDDLPGDTIELARYLVGKYLVHDLPEGRMSGRIVEMEAYPIGDSTSYAFRGRRSHNDSMFLARGHAHVRLTYGISYMLNVSSEDEGVGAGVLIRAIEPLEGLDAMTNGDACPDTWGVAIRLPGVSTLARMRFPVGLCADVQIHPLVPGPSAEQG